LYYRHGSIFIGYIPIEDVYTKHSQLVLAHTYSFVILGHELPFDCSLVKQNLWVISCISLHPLWTVDMPIQNLEA